MARTAAEVLRIARSQIGYQEGHNNDNKYGRAYGMNHVFWCQQFVWWVFRQAGAGGEMPKTAVTRVAYPWYRKHRHLVRTRDAKPGDVVWFDFSGTLKPVSHVGIVEKNLGGGRLQTIEGNTNGKGVRSGGGVLRKVRSSRIVAVGRPGFVTAQRHPAPGSGDLRYPGHPIGPGSREHGTVRWIQGRLNFWAGRARLTVDGDFGPLTERALREFQVRRGLKGLGVAGPKTWPLLNAIR
ncbi:CHAP domain-containing protein [Actinoplanes sp. NPDC049265]|uniref:CHAP domain-containing protein n=1 Tax=Actinoplanes sp. NPDC049265 TaxID=3363902 RepID=UPI0037151FC5